MTAVFGQMKAFESIKSHVTVKTQHVGDNSDCEHTQRARDLLAFYKFYVQGIEGLVDHHHHIEHRLDETEQRLRESENRYHESEQSRKALAARVEKMEKELKTTKTELENTKDQLSSTRKELTSTKEILKTTQGELSASQKKLAETNANLQSTQTKLNSSQTELGETKDQLKATETKLQQTNATLASTKAQLETTKKSLSDSEAHLNETESELSRIRERSKKSINELEAKLAKANKEHDEEKRLNGVLETEKDTAERKQRQAEEDLEDKLATSYLHRPNRTRGDIYIDEVVYGGKVYTDQSIINKILDYAAKRTPFTINNDFVGEDPWPRETKSFTVAYAIGGKGPFRYINVKEHDTVCFEKLGK